MNDDACLSCSVADCDEEDPMCAYYVPPLPIEEGTYYQRNKEKAKAYARRYYRENRDKVLERARRYQQEHRDEINARRRQRAAEKRSSNANETARS